MSRFVLCGFAVALLLVGACQTEGTGKSGSFRSNANKALTGDPYAAASK